MRIIDAFSRCLYVLESPIFARGTVSPLASVMPLHPLSLRTLFSLVLCLSALGFCPVKAAPAETRPNFVFIAVDDLNDYVSFLRDQPENFLRKVYPDDAKRAEVTSRLTPNLARLARSSLVFSRAYCASALCGPSRTALLTGIPPHVSGYYQHKEYFRELPTLRDVVTLPQYLREFGYDTIGLGKVFHGPVQRKRPDGTIEDWPDIGHSWSLFIQREIGPRGRGGHVIASPYSPGSGAMAAWDSGEKKGAQEHPKADKDELFSFGTIDLAPEDTFDFQNAAFASRLLREGAATINDRDGRTVEARLPADRPFFLACGLYAPHLPWVVPPQFYDRVPISEMAIDDSLVDWVEADIEDLSPQAIDEFVGNDWLKIKTTGEKVGGPGGIKDAWRAAFQAYLASIAYADYCLGQIVDAIEANPARDHTVVVLWSDHGWNVGDKRRFRKHALWEGANHSILLIAAPGVTPAGGAVFPNNVSLQDIYPTLVSLAGLPRPEHIYGHDLTPVLRDPTIAWNLPVLMTYNPHNHAIRTSTTSFLRYREGARELYDLSSDPFEYRNLAADPAQAARVREMNTLLDRMLAEKPADQR